MKIAILGAMELELFPYVYHLTEDEKKLLYTHHSLRTVYKEHQLILQCCGRGKVNAAYFTKKIIQDHQPDIIVNVGICGSLTDNVPIGEVVIGRAYCHYDVRKKQSQYTFPNKLYYEGDQDFMEIVMQQNPLVKSAIFATGEGFVTEQETREKIIKDFEAQTVDMESAAIAQCCYLEKTRFLGMRVVCDKADETAAATSEEFQEEACQILAKILFKTLDYKE